MQSLRGKSPAFELLELFLNSDLAAYRKWCAGNPGKLAELGLDEKATERKMRMLSLAGLAAGKEGKEVAYGTITQALEIPEGEVEVWVIDGVFFCDLPSRVMAHSHCVRSRCLAIRAGLLDARMNQVTKTVAIRRSTVRAFTQEHWKQLASKLEGWKSGLQEVLQVLGNARLLVESQQQVVEAK